MEIHLKTLFFSLFDLLIIVEKYLISTLKNSVLTKINRLENWKWCLLIFVLSVSLYAPSLKNDFALDDEIVYFANPRVQQGIAGIPAQFYKYKSKSLSDQYGFRPITMSTFNIDFQLGGKSAKSGHWGNILSYAVLSVLIFLLLSYLFAEIPKLAIFLACLMFVVHPLHVEVVANIKSRDEILSLIFGLSALFLAIYSLRTEKYFLLLLSSISFGLAFLSKESALTFFALVPMVLMLEQGPHLKKKLIFIGALVAGYAIILFGIDQWILSHTISSAEFTEDISTFRESKIMGNALFQNHLPYQRFATGFDILIRYLKNFLVPYPLVYYSGYNQVPISDWNSVWVWLSVVLHLGMLAAMIIFWKKVRGFSLGIAFYLISVSPYTHFLRPLDDAMADRFFFTPSLGLIIAFFSLLAYVLGISNSKESRSKTTRSLSSPIVNRSTFAFMLVLAIGFSVMTVNRIKAWKNNLQLFETDIANLENCARCHFQYANQLTLEFQKRGSTKKDQDAIIHHFERAIEITDESYNSFISLGRAYLVFGMPAKGFAILDRAISIFPDRAGPYFQKAYGKYVSKAYAEAVPLFQKSISIDKENQEAFFFLGWSYSQLGKSDEALQIWADGAKKWPQATAFYISIADLHQSIGQNAEMMNWLNQLVTYNPKFGEGYSRLVKNYEAFGDLNNAKLVRAKAKENGIRID